MRSRSHGVVSSRRRLPLGAVVAAALLTAAAAALLLMPLLGYRVYVVTGDSMKGTFERGALILTKTVPVPSLKVGDIITFRPPDQAALVSHRIIAVSPQPDGRIVFRTKGDYNKAPDPWQFTLDRPEQARYMAHLPYAGYVFGFLGLRPARAVLIAGFGLLMVVGVFSTLWKRPITRVRHARSDLARPGSTGRSRDSHSTLARPMGGLQDPRP